MHKKAYLMKMGDCVKKIAWCCTCCENKTKKDLYLKYNPYFFKNKACCNKCGNFALIKPKI